MSSLLSHSALDSRNDALLLVFSTSLTHLGSSWEVSVHFGALRLLSSVSYLPDARVLLEASGGPVCVGAAPPACVCVEGAPAGTAPRLRLLWVWTVQVL